jgi:hypothetical protein
MLTCEIVAPDDAVVVLDYGIWERTVVSICRSLFIKAPVGNHVLISSVVFR